MQKFQFSRQRLNQFENVQKGSTAVVNLPIGPAYLDLDIEFSGMTFAEFTEIRVKINNEVRHRYNGTQLNQLLQRVGYPSAGVSSRLVIPFVRHKLKTTQGEISTALNTGVADANGGIISSLIVEVDIAGGAADPKLELFCTVADSMEGGPGLVLSYFRDTIDANFVGEKTIGNLYTPGDRKRLVFNRCFLFTPEANLERIRVRRNNFDIYDHTPASAAIDEGTFGLKGFGTEYVIDPTVRGYGGNGFDLSAATDFRLVIDTAQAIPSMDVLSEFIGLVR